MKRIGIVGLGLIGGSIALGVRRRWPQCEVLGADASAGPWPDGLLDTFMPLSKQGDPLGGLRECELIVLAVPVGTITQMVGPALSVGEVVTDVGSTKRRIAAAGAGHARVGSFVPGHPMTGAPRGGFDNARADLFEGAPWFICPDDADPESVARVRALILGLGAEARETSAEDHDRAVALVSHLPQLLASALVRSAEDTNSGKFAGPAFERMTRGAGGGADMWADVFESNADFIAEHAAALGGQFARLAEGLSEQPPDISAAVELLASARGTKPGPTS